MNDAVKSLYEKFPYPTPVEDLTPFIKGDWVPAWNPRDSFSLYFPDQAPRDDLEVLIAGCGTNIGPQHAAAFPRMRFTAIDISESSLSHSRRVSEKHGLRNIEFFQLPLEQVGTLGRTFDFVNCHGVLHHLEDPVAGLNALAAVTKPTGALSLMVYGKYGRVGLYLLQELFKDRLALEPTEANVRRIQEMLIRLPPEHPFRILHSDRAQRISLEEIADMLLHPRDLAYTVEDIQKLVDGAGVRFVRWLGQGPYTPEVSALEGTPGLERLDRWEQAAATELFNGTISKHDFAVVPHSAPPTIDLLDPLRLASRVPVLSPHLKVEHVKEKVLLTHSLHQVPIEFALPVGPLSKLVSLIDGKQTIAQVTASAARSTGTTIPPAKAAAFFRAQFLADMIYLRVA